MRKAIACMLLLGLASAGCGEKAASKTSIPMDQVPELVMKVAQEKLPDVKFNQAWRKPNGEYEVQGKTKTGKVREIDLTPAGEVTEIE